MSESILSNAQNTRNSRVELVRIISMLLIVAYHATRIGCDNPEQPFYIYISGVLLGSWGILGVDLFVVISAYYLSDQAFKLKRLIGISFQTFTYVIFYTAISFFVLLKNTKDISYTIKTILHYHFESLLSPLWSNQYWFVTAYFFLVLVSPFLNAIILTLSQLNLKKLLLILLFVPIYSQFCNSPIGDVAAFCFIYLLVGYLKKYGQTFIESFAKMKNVLLLICIIIVGRIFLYFPLPAPIILLIKISIAMTARHSFIMLVLSVCIFFVVIKQKPFFNKAVNKIAACTLGVYLFHEQCLIYDVNTLDYIFAKCTEHGILGLDYLFPFRFTAIVLGVYVAGIAIEYFRMMIIQRPFLRLIDNKYSSILAKMENAILLDNANK